MARTLYFLDGSREVLLCDEFDTEKNAEALEQILREHLGNDAAELFLEILASEEEPDDYELACDEYRGCLQDVLSGLKNAAALLDAPRIDRKKLKESIDRLITQINNEL